jgi:O-antigen ligase
MTFRLFLLCSFVLLARPQDVFTVLQPLRPALVLMVLAAAALLLGGRAQGLPAALARPETKRYLAFFAIMLAGIPFAYHKGQAFEAVVLGYSLNVLYFILLVSQVTTLERLKRLVWILCLATAMYSLIGGLLQSGSLAGGRFQVAGDAFDPNDTAYVLLALFPLCLYFVRFDEGSTRRLIALAAVCSALATILLTGSRGGLLALGAVLLILLLSRVGNIGAGAKALIVVALALAWALLGDVINVERYKGLFDLSSDYNVAAQGGRLDLWQRGVEMSLDHPLTGVGVDSFAFANHEYRTRAGETFLRWQVPHNSFVQVAAEVGLIGFALFAFINLRSVVTFIRASASRSAQPTPPSREFAAMGGLMLLGFAGLLVSGFFLSQGYSIFATLYFALAASMERIREGMGTVAERANGNLRGAPIADAREDSR